MFLSHGAERLQFPNVVYVHANGDDVTGVGSKSNPFKTLAKAISVAQLNDGIMIGEGVYTIGKFSDFMTAKNLTYIGQNEKTIVEVLTVLGNEAIPAGRPATFYNFKMRPADNCSGDTRFMHYFAASTGVVKLRSYNMVYERSLNNRFPSSSMFIYAGSGSSTVDVVFERCSVKFAGESYTQSRGVTYLNCALTSTGNGSAVVTNSKLLSTWTVNDRLTSNDNDIYGVYGGLYTWDKQWVDFILKYLVMAGGYAYAHEAGMWTNVGEIPVVDLEMDALFEAKGMDAITSIQLNQLQNAVPAGIAKIGIRQK